MQRGVPELKPFSDIGVIYTCYTMGFGCGSGFIEKLANGQMSLITSSHAVATSYSSCAIYVGKTIRLYSLAESQWGCILLRHQPHRRLGRLDPVWLPVKRTGEDRLEFHEYQVVGGIVQTGHDQQGHLQAVCRSQAIYLSIYLPIYLAT